MGLTGHHRGVLAQDSSWQLRRPRPTLVAPSLTRGQLPANSRRPVCDFAGALPPSLQVPAQCRVFSPGPLDPELLVLVEVGATLEQRGSSVGRGLSVEGFPVVGPFLGPQVFDS